MAKAKNSVWLGELERFGYNLVVVGRTEKEVRDALAEEYIRTYKQINGDECDPREEYPYYSDNSYFDEAMEEAYVREMPFGKVEWC